MVYFHTELDELLKEPEGWNSGFFTNGRGMKLRHGSLKNHDKPKANIVLVHGLSEYLDKFFELSRIFNERGCNLYTYDQAGCGLSERFDYDRSRSHTDSMDEDIRDLLQFRMDHVPDNAPTIVFGHSTGGLIVTRAAQTEPEAFDGAVLSSPLLGHKIKAARATERLLAHADFLPDSVKKKYAPSVGPWKKRTGSKPDLPSEDFTRDPIRQQLHDHLPIHNPDYRIGGPTLGWMIERAKGMRDALKDENIRKIRIPFFAAAAGEDVLVNNEKLKSLMSRIPTPSHMMTFVGAKHELYLETEDVRDALVSGTMDLIDKIRSQRRWSPR